MIGEIAASTIWNTIAWGRPTKASPRGLPLDHHARDASTGIAACRTPSGSAAWRGPRMPSGLSVQATAILIVARPSSRRAGSRSSDPDPRPAYRRDSRRRSRIASSRHAPTAPGTTVIALSRASARRSRFCAVIYSSACQRVTRLTRLPTFALPATAPSRGIDEPAREPGDRSRLELRIGIERDDDLAASTSIERVIERAGLAAIFQRQQSHARFVGECFGDDRAGAIARSVVDRRSLRSGHRWNRSTPRTARSITRSSLKAGIITVTKRSGSIGGKIVATLAPRLDQRERRQRDARGECRCVIAKMNSQRSATTIAAERDEQGKIGARSQSVARPKSAASPLRAESPASVDTGTKR